MNQVVRLALFVVLVVFLGITLPASRIQAATPAIQSLSNYDIRVLGGDQLTTLLAQYVPAGTQGVARSAGTRAVAMQRGLAQLKRRLPGASVQFSPLTGAAEVVRSSHGALTSPAPGHIALDIARDFLRDNQALYGLSAADVNALHFLGESLSSKNGLRMVRLEQQVEGLPVFQSDTRFLVASDGRLIRSVGLLMPELTSAAVARGQSITAGDALAAAMDSVGISVDAQKTQVVSANDDASKVELVAHSTQVVDEVVSELVYFPLAPGLVVPAWSQVTYTSGPGTWYTLVDARTGTLLWRKNIRSNYVIAPQQQTVTPSTAASTPGQRNNPTRAAQSIAPAEVTQDARFSVYVQGDGSTPTSPAPRNPTDVAPGAGTQFPAIDRTTVSMLAVRDATASPNGWIADNGTTTTGNNVDAYLDTTPNNQPDTGLLDNNGRPIGNPDADGRNRDFLGAAPRDYSYTPAPQNGNPEAGDSPALPAFRRGAVTQLFYTTNWYHDQLYKYGFDEAAGNFQSDNFSRGGVGNDPVLAEVQDGSGTNNANFSTLPDGRSGRMQMYLFTRPNPDRDGSLDADVVLHELTHGLSNRLIGNGNGLIWDEAGSMGEGWSDFYSLSLQNSSADDDPNAPYTTGGYVTYKLTSTFTDNYVYGIRRFPYTTDNTVNPLTWADIDDTTIDPSGGIPQSPVISNDSGGLEVHNAGQVWALSLWEVRSRIIADPAGANGNVPLGNATMLQLTTDAMKMTPINPSFIDARDALIDADCATNACANERSIWAGFADRGLGYGAVAPLGQDGINGFAGHLGVGESFSVPDLDVANVAVDDSRSNGNGAIDPGELISVTVGLDNPWRNASQTADGVSATLSSSTPGVTLVHSNAAYASLAPQDTSAGSFSFTVDQSIACGQALKFTLQINSSLGTISRDFTLRAGQDAGTGTPVTYTHSIPNGLAIPDNTPLGVTDSFAITDDLEIADLDFQVDSLIHPWTGDLGVMLKAPNGYGTDLIYYRGIFYNNPTVSDGDNFINTRIDDEATADLNQAKANQAPFTGSWKPAFNSPIWNLFDSTNLGPDPVGQLSRLDGTSTQGVWRVHVSDVNFSSLSKNNSGKLNSWSLIVTPKAFSCTAFTPGASVTGTKSFAGNTGAGGTITYTVVLANKGTAAQTDNPGDEFTDVLPSQLTLGTASANVGVVGINAGTGTVTWNGPIAVDGTATLTIIATINQVADGTTVANQGTIAFDSDNNATNDVSAVTDDPSTPAANDPTSFTVGNPRVQATQTATLTTDRNGNKKVDPGDVLTYKVELTNTGSGDAVGVTFTSGLDTNTALVVGATVTSQGSVANGTTQAVVQIGTLPHTNGSATITFQAAVANTLPAQTTQLSTQGIITGSNFATVLTDDPATSAPNDTTITLLGTSAGDRYRVYLPVVINATLRTCPLCPLTQG